MAETMTFSLLRLLAATTFLAAPGLAVAQVNETPSKAPVTFLSDQVAYDKTGNIVTATGHVKAWQNGQTLYADKVVIDRTKNIATAIGHVVLVAPDGQTAYANHAVLTQGMKNAVMQGVSARLEQNARLMGNGARRYNDQIDEMTKVVYSACNLCQSDPRRAPTWQIHATTATRDLQHKMIEYHNAVMEFDGFPFFYTPYMTQPDPSVKRQTGLLIPAAGVSGRLGFFAEVPYYVVIGPSSDVTLTPILATKQGPVLDAKYRKFFNDGRLYINASVGKADGQIGDSVFANGDFDLNQDWRAGFSYNHASNPTYLDDFNILPNASYLTSTVYLEGFAPGSYARLDASTYQGLVASIDQSELPIVAPHGQYDFVSDQDSLGGRFGISADTFNIFRKVGSNTKRVSAMPDYEVPLALPGGIVGDAKITLIAATYSASRLFSQPNYSTLDGADTGRAIPYGNILVRWPFLRSSPQGSQIIEPEVQLVAAPEIGLSQNLRIPNEDSLDLDFSDANLFDLNRYPGIDRLEGGERVDYALHGAWYLPNGMYADGLFGQSYRFHKDDDFLPESGLNDNVSDFVGHVILVPSSIFNITYRTRLSHDDLGARMIDGTANLTLPHLNLSGGYLYSNTDPYVLYDTAPAVNVDLNPPAGYFTPRKEFTASAGTSYDGWTVGAGTERDLVTGKFDAANFNLGWSNDCFGISLNYYERFTSFNLDSGNTAVFVQLTFKTLGSVGLNAL
jgi:LPS-assembly protein